MININETKELLSVIERQQNHIRQLKVALERLEANQADTETCWVQFDPIYNDGNDIRMLFPVKLLVAELKISLPVETRELADMEEELRCKMNS